MEMTGRSQNFRLLEIARRETASPKVQSKLGNKVNSPGLTQDTKDVLPYFSPSLAHGLPILTLPKETTFPCARQMKDVT